MLSRLRPIHFILLVGLLLRLLNWYQQSVNNPIFDLPIVDAKEYVDDATYYNDVNWLGGGGSYFHPPGYSYFIGIIFLFFGKSLFAIRLVQTGLDLVNLYLLFLIAQRLFGLRAALLSALMYAVYVRFIQYSVEILPPVLVIFLLLASLYMLLCARAQEEYRMPLPFIASSALSLGLLIITLPNFLLILPAMLLWVFFLPGGDRKTAAGLTTLFLCVSLSPVFLTALRNRLVADEGLLISRNGGINFYIGNNPDIKKTVGATPGIDWDKLLMLPYQEERTTDFQQQDDRFGKKVLDFVLQHPQEWLSLMWKKTAWYFSAHEFPRNFDVYHFAGYSFVTKYPLLNLNILFPLGLAGLLTVGMWPWLVAVRQRRANLETMAPFLVAVIFFIYSFSIVLVFIAARYRLPVLPLMVLFAAPFLSGIYDLFRHKNFKRLSAHLLLLAALALITNIKFYKEDYPFNASPVFTRTLIANTLINAGQQEVGKKYLEEALLLPQDEATDDALFELAHYCRGNGEKEKAKELFLKAVALDPTHYKSWNSLGFDLKMEGKFPAAIHALKKGIEVAPCFPELYLNLADCYLVRDKIDSALIELNSYYQHCPSPHPSINESLGKIYMERVLDFEKAAGHYEEAIAFPQGFDPTAEHYNRLGACRFKLQEYKKAKDAWKKGLKLSPGHKAILLNIEHAVKEVQRWKAL